VKASVSITGKLWQLKAQPEALKDVVVEAQLKRQQLTTHFIRKSRRSVFTPDRVSIESESGILEEGRRMMLKTLAAHIMHQSLQVLDLYYCAAAESIQGLCLLCFGGREI
jgi:hypothetical protein